MIQGPKNEKKRGDKLSTGLSNWGLAFVFNKTTTPGWGLAEGRKQKAAKTKNFYHRGHEGTQRGADNK